MGVYVGDKRYAPYVGSTRRKMMAEKALPYDAEIEYLESSGIQWIDTQLGVGYDTKLLDIQLEFEHLTTAGGYKWVVFAGGNNKYVGIQRNRDTINIDGRAKITPVVLDKKRTYRFNGGLESIDNEEFPPLVDLSLNMNIILFSAISTIHLETCRIWYAKIIYDNVLMGDFIPVRVGQVGYMYDRVSGELFGNSGTGDFVLGPDINN